MGQSDLDNLLYLCTGSDISKNDATLNIPVCIVLVNSCVIMNATSEFK